MEVILKLETVKYVQHGTSENNIGFDLDQIQVQR